MVGVFRRSLSFPNKNPSRPSKPPISHHIRSISLPCRSHPLISHLRVETAQLRAWSSSKPDDGTQTSTWHCHGLSRLKEAHDSLHDILQLPQTQDSLRRQPDRVERLLEDFLRFVDVYGIFQTSVLSLKEAQLFAQVAVRKRDDSKIAPYIKSRERMAKEMTKLVHTIRSVARCSIASASSIGDAELLGVVGDVIEATVAVSVALFNGISASFASRRSCWVRALRLPKKANRVSKVGEGIRELLEVDERSLRGLGKKGDEEVKMVLKKMRDLEEFIGCVESGGEKVFRSLINTRVLLLNSFSR